MLKVLTSLLLPLFLVMFLPAQSDATSGNSGTDATSSNDFDLGPGEAVTDSDGRTVQNTGTKGSLKITYTGKKSGKGKDIEISGKITLVKNPKSGGVKGGKIKIGSNDKKTKVILEDSGLSGKPITTYLDGNNIDVDVTGNYNNFSFTGTNCEVDITGNHNTGYGFITSGGSTHLGGRGNSWSGPGDWLVHN